MLSNALRLNLYYLKIIHILHQCDHSKTIKYFFYYVILYYIILHNIILYYYIISYYIILYYVMSYHVILFYVIVLYFNTAYITLHAYLVEHSFLYRSFDSFISTNIHFYRYS